MGFCYAMQGGRRLLVCESCGAAEGTTRKRSCPAGWCQASAMCAACWKDPEKRDAFKAWHVEHDCAGASARFAEEQAKVAALHAAGEYVFCASVYDDVKQETVKCWFRNGSGKTQETVVSKEVRDTFTRTTTFESLAGAVA